MDRFLNSRIAEYLVYLILLIFTGLIFSWGINHSILEHHAFRQTQTASNIFWRIKEGLLSNVSPVSLPPWQMPRELPLYQFTVSCICKLFDLRIEFGSRIVSISFFYASCVLVHRISTKIHKEKITRIILLTLFSLSPVYLFWSRTCMIESTALFFSLLFILQVLRYDHNSNVSSILFIVTGIIAALVKITTFLPYCLVSFFYLAIKRNYSPLSGKLISLYSPVIISIVCWFFYCKYSVKDDFIYNDASPEGYKWISNVHQNILNPTFHSTLFWEITFLVLPVSFYIFFAFIYDKSVTNKILMISFFLTVFIFSNLYIVHDYYIYGSGILVLIFISSKISLFIKAKSKIFQYSFLLLLLIIGILNYITNGYFDLQKKDIKLHSALVNKISDVKGNPIIIGSYLDPTIPYMIKRKCVTIGNFKNNNDSLSKTLSEINAYCTKRDHEIDFCLMMNDQNLTHVRKLSDEYFGTTQFTVFDKYTLIH